MNNFSKNYTSNDGAEETIVASSEDNYNVNLGDYTLANHHTKKENALAKKFRSSILGADIGIKSSGFSSVAILATVIALSVAVIIYFIWRF